MFKPLQRKHHYFIYSISSKVRTNMEQKMEMKNHSCVHIGFKKNSIPTKHSITYRKLSR